MELISIRDNVSMLAKQVHAACNLGIKREDLVVDKNQKNVGVEISREELFNVLHPTYGYMATKDAIQIMNRGRKRIKKKFIVIGFLFIGLLEYNIIQYFMWGFFREAVS